jgi:pyrroloquinoline quinone biosynthesis protein E
VSVRAPASLLCELTYRCNLQCGYCYNPVDLGAYREEIGVEDWLRAIEQAVDLGVVQIGFSGGEPTLRGDLVELVARANELGAYTNLITQGTFLSESLLDELLDAGLPHIQISLQGNEPQLAARFAGTDVHDKKIDAIRRTARRDVALTLNYVLHRGNHHTLGDIIALAEREGIRKLEIANVQFYGWALKNRAKLLPTREQVERGRATVEREQARLRGRMEIVYVVPDYFEELPKPCMHGWGQVALTVAPDGRVLPCQAAASIAGLTFPNVRETSLQDAWYRSEAFSHFRGTAWMPEPCRSCDRREFDWGGCRCQAFALTGNAAVADPACAKSPDHGIITALRDEFEDAPMTPRRMPAGTAS